MIGSGFACIPTPGHADNESWQGTSTEEDSPLPRGRPQVQFLTGVVVALSIHRHPVAKPNVQNPCNLATCKALLDSKQPPCCLD